MKIKKSRPLVIDNQKWFCIKETNGYILYINKEKNTWSYILFSIGSVISKKTGFCSRGLAIKKAEENAKEIKAETNKHIEEIKCFLNSYNKQ